MRTTAFWSHVRNKANAYTCCEPFVSLMSEWSNDVRVWVKLGYSRNLLTVPISISTPRMIDHEIQHLAWYSLLLWPAKFPLSPSCLAIMACTSPITPHGKQQNIVEIIPHTYQHVVFCSPGGCNKWKQVYKFGEAKLVRMYEVMLVKVRIKL